MRDTTVRNFFHAIGNDRSKLHNLLIQFRGTSGPHKNVTTSRLFLVEPCLVFSPYGIVCLVVSNK